MKSRIRNQDNAYKIIIYSDETLNATYKYTINHDTNILTISEIFNSHSIGKIHSLISKPNTFIIEARVSFKSNISIHPLKKAGLFFKNPVLIPATNVYIQII